MFNIYYLSHEETKLHIVIYMQSLTIINSILIIVLLAGFVYLYFYRPGPAGERGPQGERGMRGERGGLGFRGERGIQGPAGPPGQNVINGEAVPSAPSRT